MNKGQVFDVLDLLGFLLSQGITLGDNFLQDRIRAHACFEIARQVNQRFGWHAANVGAVAANMIAFDERHLPP